MKLEGSLDAFGLSDVFHLLQATGKTGGLWLRRDGVEAVVHLDEGRIVGASIDPTRLALLRRLVMSGAVDEDSIADAAGHAGEHGIGLVAALLALELVDEPVATATARGLAVDVVFDLLRWPDGDFSFAADDRPDDDVGLRLATAEAVDEARARFERWEHAAVAVPSPASVPSISEVVAQESLVMTPTEWAVLALVDGRRTVQEIVDLMAVGAFDVVTVLSDLVERELVQVAPPDAEVALHRRLRRLELMRILDEAASATTDGSAEAAPVRPAEPASSPTPPTSRAADAAPSPVPPVPSAATPATPTPQPPAPARQAARPEPSPARAMGASRGAATSIVGANAVAAVEHETHEEASVDPGEHDELDPLFNRSLVLRLIAGVRGL